MTHVRIVLNQLGAAMELHRDNERPVTLTIVSPSELEAYRATLAESNPDMRHSTIGQLASMYAVRIFRGVHVDPAIWSYNASEDRYTRGAA